MRNAYKKKARRLHPGEILIFKIYCNDFILLKILLFNIKYKNLSKISVKNQMLMKTLSF